MLLCVFVDVHILPVYRVWGPFSTYLYLHLCITLLFQNCNYSWLPEPHGCFLARQEYSLYILSPDNYIRRSAFHVISQRWFDNTVLFFIALNCITLAMERPDIPPDSIVCLYSICFHFPTLLYTYESFVLV